MEVNGNQNCLVTNIPQNIFFCVQQKKRKPYRFGTTWVEYTVTDFHFWVDYHLRYLLWSNHEWPFTQDVFLHWKAAKHSAVEWTTRSQGTFLKMNLNLTWHEVATVTDAHLAHVAIKHNENVAQMDARACPVWKVPKAASHVSLT